MIPKLIDPKSGRLHTSFHQAAASTGRLSSSNPNLQNIPVRADLGRKIRGAFVPEEGWWFVSADYSQVELRILAHLSGDAAARRSVFAPAKTSIDGRLRRCWGCRSSGHAANSASARKR